MKLIPLDEPLSFKLIPLDEEPDQSQYNSPLPGLEQPSESPVSPAIASEPIQPTQGSQQNVQEAIPLTEEQYQQALSSGTGERPQDMLRSGSLTPTVEQSQQIQAVDEQTKRDKALSPWKNENKGMVSDNDFVDNTVNTLGRGALADGFYQGLKGLSGGVGQELSRPPIAEGWTPEQRAQRKSVLEAQIADPMSDGLIRAQSREQLKELERAATGERSKWDKIGMEAGEYLKEYSQESGRIQQGVKKSLPVDKSFEESIGGKIIGGFGQMFGTLPTYVIPGFGPVMTVGQIYQSGVDDAKETPGVTDEQAHRAGIKNIPSAIPEYLADKTVLGRALKPLVGKSSVGDIVKSVLITAGTGGASEGTQQWWTNFVAKNLEGYDPTRKLTKGVMESIIVGAVVDSVTTGGIQGIGAIGANLNAVAEKEQSPIAPDPNLEVNQTETEILAKANELLKPSEDYKFGFEVVEPKDKEVKWAEPPVNEAPTTVEEVLPTKEGQDSGEAIKTPVAEESETIPESQPRIESTALKFGDKIVKGEGIQAHAELTPQALEQFIDDPNFNPDQIEYGFIDSEGNFKSRSEAEPIAVNAGQVREGYKPEGNLQSQDLLNTPVKPSGSPLEASQLQKVTQTQPEQQQAFKSESPTGIKNAQIEKERAAKGLPPRIEPLRKSFGKSWDEAMAKVDSNPAAGTGLVESVLKEPRATNDVENALLLHEKVVRETVFNNAVDKVNNAADDTERSEALAEMEQALNKVNEVNSAADVTGTLTARGLSSRRMMVNDDFTLARMVSETQAIVNQGKPLSDKQFKETQELHKKLEEYRKRIEELESNTSEKGAKETIDQLLKEFRKGVQATRKTKEGRKLLFEERYQKASERRRKSLGQLNVGLDPIALVDYAVIGAYYIEKGARSLADFTNRLVKEFGEAIRQHAGDIYSKAQEVHADTDKLFTTQKEELTPDQIVAQHEEGTPLEGKVVHDLARYHINNGVEGFENVMKAVQKDLKAVDESLTPRDINDALSGYGKVRYPSKEKDLATLREYKALARLTSQLEDAEKKLVPKKTGYQRDKASAEVRELQKRVSDTMKKLGIETRDPETQLASSQQAAKTRLRNEIEELDLAIKNKSKIAREKGVVKLDAEGEALKAQRDKKKEEYDALFPESEEVALDNAIKAAEKSIARYDEMLKSGNLTPEQRKAKFTPTGELETLQSLREAMAKAVAELRKAQAPRTPPEETARKNAIKALDKSIADYDRKLKEGDFSSRPTKPSKTAGMDDVQTKRSERDAIRKLFEELKRAQVPKRDPALVRLGARKKAIQTEINKLEQKIKDNDYVIPEKSDPLTDDELIKLQFEREKIKEKYLEGLFQAQLAQRSRAARIWDTTKETFGTLRAIMTGGELSAVLRQGGWYVMGHPIKGLKATVPMLKAFRSEANQYKIDQEIKNNPYFPMAKQAKVFFSDYGSMDLRKMEENYMSRTARKIPLIAGSQRAYSTFLNKIRMDQFESLVKSLGTDGKVTKDQARAIAAFVNISTGRGDLKAAEKALVGMNLLFFAPSYTISRFQMLLGYPLWRGLFGKEKAGFKARALIAKEYARSLIGLSIFYSMAVAAADAFDWDMEIETDPRSPNFGKLRFGNIRLDPLMGLEQANRFLWKEISGTKKTARGKVQSLTKENPGPFDDTRLSVGLDFVRTKLAPVPGAAVNLLEGRNLIGEKSTVPKEALNMAFPITWREIYQTVQEEGVVKAAVPSALSFLGMGMQTYDPNKKKKD